MSRCYSCAYRRSIPGDCHSRCAHPTLGDASNDALAEMMGITLDQRKRARVIEAAGKLKIRGAAHGVANGWFKWPYNFDPVWLLNCNGYKEAEDGTVQKV